MEGIEACIENIDDSVMNELSVQLSTMIRKAVGLPTKVSWNRKWDRYQDLDI